MGSRTTQVKVAKGQENTHGAVISTFLFLMGSAMVGECCVEERVGVLLLRETREGVERAKWLWGWVLVLVLKLKSTVSRWTDWYFRCSECRY